MISRGRKKCNESAFDLGATSHLRELVRTAVRRNMAPRFDLRLTGPTGDHFQYQIDGKDQILPQEDASPRPSLLLTYLPLRITLVR
jgi:hypothetical protein